MAGAPVSVHEPRSHQLDVPYVPPAERGPKGADVLLPKLRAWSSASRPTSDYARRVLAQATVVKPGRVHPNNVPVIIAASRLPVPAPKVHAEVPAFPEIEAEEEALGVDDVHGWGKAGAAAARARGSKFPRGE